MVTGVKLYKNANAGVSETASMDIDILWGGNQVSFSVFFFKNPITTYLHTPSHRAGKGLAFILSLTPGCQSHGGVRCAAAAFLWLTQPCSMAFLEIPKYTATWNYRAL